jgi:hypothetical protein
MPVRLATMARDLSLGLLSLEYVVPVSDTEIACFWDYFTVGTAPGADQSILFRIGPVFFIGIIGEYRGIHSALRSRNDHWSWKKRAGQL